MKNEELKIKNEKVGSRSIWQRLLFHFLFFIFNFSFL